jgi:hypothetical protein
MIKNNNIRTRYYNIVPCSYKLLTSLLTKLITCHTIIDKDNISNYYTIILCLI